MKNNANIPDRTTQPAIHIPARVEMPPAQKSTASNGIPLFTLESGDVEVIRLSLVFHAGNSFQQHPFVASTTLSILNEGTENYTAAEISEKFDFYGSIYEINIDRDYSMITVCALSRYFEKTLELLEDILLRPVFPEYEIKVYANKRKQKLEVERTKVGYRSRELFGAALFGKDHPYGVYSEASEYDNVTEEQLREFYKKHYIAENCFAVTSGFITSEHQKAIITLLEKIPSGRTPEAAFIPPVTTPYTYVEQEDAVQSAIRIGKRLFPRNHPDFIGMQIVSMVLGGYFGSRLVTNLREEKGYTYGIFSGMVNFEREGYLAISTEVRAEVTEQATAEIFREIERLREDPVSEEELEIIKNTITGELMRLLDGPFGIADITIENFQNNISNDYINCFLEEVKTITPQRLQELANKYLSADDFVTVIVGKK